MAFNSGKLENEYVVDSLSDICSQYCDPIKNPSRICLPECTSFCVPSCIFPYPPLPPIDVPNTWTNEYTRPDNHRKNFHFFLIICLTIILTIFILSFGSMLCKARYWARRRQALQRRPQTDGGNRDNLDQARDPEIGLDPSVISSISTCKYKKGDGIVEETECSVCLGEFQEDETLRLLPNCKHAFHTPCVDKWLKSHTSCPMCRADIIINPVGVP